MERSERKTYLDVLRILAGFLVVFNHVAGQNMRLFSGTGGVVALFLFYLSKSAIPLFLMVSGAVMLDRVEPYGKFAKRIGRIVLALLLASLLHYGARCLSAQTPFVPRAFFDILYHYQASNSLWYLYAYIGLLVMMPILQRMTASFGDREYRYFAFWTLLYSGGMPVLQAISSIFTPDSAFELSVFSGVIGMAVLGRWMDSQARVTGRGMALAIMIPLCAAAAAVALTMQNQARFAALDNAFTLPSMATACGVAYLMKCADARLALSERARGRITHAGSLIFCTYLIGDFAVERLQFVREALVPLLRTNGAGVVYTLLVFIICMLLSEGLTRIPGLRKIL